MRSHQAHCANSTCTTHGIGWTLLPLLRSDAWWVRVFEFPRVQITFISAAVLVLHAAVVGWRDPADRVLLGGLALCLCLQLVRIVRCAPFHPLQMRTAVQQAQQDVLGLMVTKVATPNHNAEALLRLVRERRPYLLLTEETDQWWQDYPVRTANGSRRGRTADANIVLPATH